MSKLTVSQVSSFHSVNQNSFQKLPSYQQNHRTLSPTKQYHQRQQQPQPTTQTPPSSTKLVHSRLKNVNNSSQFNIYDYTPSPSSQQKCIQCGMVFQGTKQLLNHQRNFCTNSGYDSLNTLIKKEIHNDVDGGGGFAKKKNNNKMKSYGQYSLTNLKHHHNTNSNILPVVSKNHAKNNRYHGQGLQQQQLLHNDMMKLNTHRDRLNQADRRHYQYRSHGGQSHVQAEGRDNFKNSKSGSAFSYKLDPNQFRQNIASSRVSNPNHNHNHNNYQKAQNLQRLLQKKTSLMPPQQQPTSSYKQNFQNLSSASQLEKQFLIRAKDNPASKRFKQQFSVLERSNASIANMSGDQKHSYAYAKLDQLQTIQQLYLKNGGQSKQFSQNIDKMVEFYKKMLQNSKKDSSEIQTQLSIASRPDTPIHRLNDLSSNKRAQKQNDKQTINTSRYVLNSNGNFNGNVNGNVNGNNHQQHHQQQQFQQPNLINQSYSMPLRQAQQSTQPNYAELYHMRIMEDMLRMKSEDNRKLIEALIAKNGNSQQNNSAGEDQLSNNNVSAQNAKKYGKGKGFDLRLALEADPKMASQDKILKMLQAQELDEINLLANLPVALQDEKVESLKQNTELRYRMEKEILKQKLERLSWQAKIQAEQQERQLNNSEWVGGQRKQVVKGQMSQYLNNFSYEYASPLGRQHIN